MTGPGAAVCTPPDERAACRARLTQKKSPAAAGEVLGGARGRGDRGDRCLPALSVGATIREFGSQNCNEISKKPATGEPFRSRKRKTPRERGVDSSQDLGRFSSTHLAWASQCPIGLPSASKSLVWNIPLDLPSMMLASLRSFAASLGPPRLAGLLIVRPDVAASGSRQTGLR